MPLTGPWRCNTIHTSRSSLLTASTSPLAGSSLNLRFSPFSQKYFTSQTCLLHLINLCYLKCLLIPSCRIGLILIPDDTIHTYISSIRPDRTRSSISAYYSLLLYTFVMKVLQSMPTMVPLRRLDPWGDYWSRTVVEGIEVQIQHSAGPDSML